MMNNPVAANNAFCMLYQALASRALWFFGASMHLQFPLWCLAALILYQSLETVRLRAHYARQRAQESALHAEREAVIARLQEDLDAALGDKQLAAQAAAVRDADIRTLQADIGRREAARVLSEEITVRQAQESACRDADSQQAAATLEAANRTLHADIAARAADALRVQGENEAVLAGLVDSARRSRLRAVKRAEVIRTLRSEGLQAQESARLLSQAIAERDAVIAERDAVIATQQDQLRVAREEQRHAAANARAREAALTLREADALQAAAERDACIRTMHAQISKRESEDTARQQAQERSRLQWSPLGQAWGNP
jgi:hypothetical protein